MKRVYVALATLMAIAVVCGYSLYRVHGVYEELNMQLVQVVSALEAQDQQRLEETVQSLCSYWKEEELSLIHIVRHAQIDEITKSVARLPALATRGEYGHLLAELDSIGWQIEHIWESELPTVRNIL